MNISLVPVDYEEEYRSKVLDVIRIGFKILVDGKEKYWIRKCRIRDGYSPVVIELKKNKIGMSRRILNLIEEEKGKIKFYGRIYRFPGGVNERIKKVAEGIFKYLPRKILFGEDLTLEYLKKLLLSD
jgi:hypothetical protein